MIGIRFNDRGKITGTFALYMCVRAGELCVCI